MNEFLRKFRAQYEGAYDDLSDQELLGLIHRQFYSDMSMEDFVRALDETHKLPESTGPTPPLPFNELSPETGGAVDALSAMMLPAATLSPLVPAPARNALMGRFQELLQRSPSATVASASAPLALGRLSMRPVPVPRPRPNPLLPPHLQAGRPGPAAAAPSAQSSEIAKIILRRALPTAGAGALIDRLFFRR